MPNDTPSLPGQTYVDMSSAPGGDLSFDDLFPVEDGNQTQPQAAVPGQTPPSTPQAQESNEPFLDIGSSKYLTREEAIRGYSEKDKAIDRLRQFAIQQTGYDPLTERQVRETPSHQPPPTQPDPYTYLGKGQKFYDELADAATRQDKDAYERTMRMYQTELLNATIGPAAPLLGEVARQRAIREVSNQLPEFNKFIDSSDYRETLEQMPTLKSAIQMGESDFNMAPKLGELYKLAYLASAGSRRLTASPAVPVQPTQAARPTTTPSTMTPPPPGSSNQSTDWSSNREARQGLIKDYEARGIKDIKW